MSARRDPTEIGTDEYGNSILTYYKCNDGVCVEIYDLKCQRRCNELEFDMSDKNSVIISEERIIIASCSKKTSPERSKITNNVSLKFIFYLDFKNNSKCLPEPAAPEYNIII